jgi:hypothetical protein
LHCVCISPPLRPSASRPASFRRAASSFIELFISVVLRTPRTGLQSSYELLAPGFSRPTNSSHRALEAGKNVFTVGIMTSKQGSGYSVSTGRRQCGGSCPVAASTPMQSTAAREWESNAGVIPRTSARL